MESKILGKPQGRKVAPEGTEGVHRANWMPEQHPGTSQIPYILNPVNISSDQNRMIRKIWRASYYQGRDFSPFSPEEVPSKYRLGQVVVCGLKAACATYSQHWQGTYLDWSFNDECTEALSLFRVKLGGEYFVRNAFATVVLFNTGYGGGFMDMLKMRRRPIPPSMLSLENIDMGTFEHNLRSAVCAVLGGEFGVNVIRQSLAKDLVKGPNREGYEALKKIALMDGMAPDGKICSVIQIGFKNLADREKFEPAIRDLAAAKIIERKSERRLADFSRPVSLKVMLGFLKSFKHELNEFGLKKVVKTHIVEGNTEEGRRLLERIRESIKAGLEKTHKRILECHEDNLKDGITTETDFNKYKNIADFIISLGSKVLKPREDAHKMVFVSIELDELQRMGVPIDVAEHAVGLAVQAGLNSVHLDGTTNIPDGRDMRYGAFCLTGPIHAAELNDTDEQLNRGWGNGLWDIIEPGNPRNRKMEVIISICAKNEQDAIIAEKQAMEERKSVNDIFWYRTWNHPEGKKLDLKQWISYSHVLNVLPIPCNDIPLEDTPLPEYLPENNPVSESFIRRFSAQL